jgi:hypothetical protein
MKETFDFKHLHAQIVFADESFEEEIFHQENLVQLFPYGLSLATDAARPLLLLKDETFQYTLPVAISPIEAGVAMSQNNKSKVTSTPHRFTEHLLQSLDMEIKQAVFVEIRGSHQYLRLYLSGHKEMNSIKLRADEVMSLCLHLNVPLFATKAYIGRSRVMNAAMESREQKQATLGFIMDKPGYLN